MRESQGQLVKRLDYQATAFLIDSVELTFDLDPAKTRVLNRMRMRRNPAVAAQALRLDGEELNLARVLVDGQGASFKIEQGQLVLERLPEGLEPFELEIFTTCNPAKNTALSGLYVSQETFFTQCEAEGFRRITYFLDRPDVMASYSVTLRADKAAYPVLLSNGNLVEQGDLDDGRHFARWLDPHRKPCYLFALVAGRLVCREQRIRSRLGGEHLLQVYVRAGDLDKTEHAMKSLMHSIAWDEARFGLSLDLERFMIVATSDFNMGAMENKGLNIFNTKYVLAHPASATDVDFAHVESVVAHEYFHNWTGNRVTCRDWFQLSLKEGLTVFRDQEFSQDMAGSPSARAVKRIEDVRLLRNVQFAEDAGPMAHPVRPDSYLEINNFYTVTIYEKGAEVVRMMQTLVGRDGFAQGMKLYFQRHDGQAVTCDDFAQAMADANPDSPLAQHLDTFKHWYSQSGTPTLKVSTSYDAEHGRYTLTVRQFCAASAGQSDKLPFVVPIQLGLLSASGEEICPSTLRVLTETEQSWVFENIAAPPVPSLMRDFSAPVTLHYPYTRAELLTLLAHDSDAFNRWEAAQRLCLGAAVQALQTQQPPQLGAELIQALRAVLRHPGLDAAFKELVLTLPSETYMGEQLESVDPQRVHAVREALRAELASSLRADWQWAYATHRHQGAYVPNAEQSGQRSLSALALSMLCLDAVAQGDEVWQGKTWQAFKDATNMTDRFSALSALVQSGSALAEQALQRFHAMYRHEALVIDKWFALQASACDRGGDVLPRVRQLLLHPDFEIRNPNRARSLMFSFCNGNPAGFHRADASGYVLWAEKVIEIDSFNPQVAARLARALDRWRKLSAPYRDAAREAIARVAAKVDLSPDVREVVSRTLSES
jgi:aminopeptidase N